MSTETLLVALEGLLVFGGALAFGLWQLHSVKKDQEKLRRQREQQNTQDQSTGTRL